MRNSLKKNLLDNTLLGRFFNSSEGRTKRSSKRSLLKAPRRRDIEHLEERQMLSVNYADDPLFQDQWHLKATGQQVEQPDSPTFLQSLATQDINVIGAWELGYSGSGVQIAVVDSGFDTEHPDLEFVFLVEDGAMLDLVNGDNDPSYVDTTDYHGTAVAGIIGASDNTVGGIGVAPGSDLVPIRFIPGDNDAGITIEVTESIYAALEFLQFAGVPAPGDDGSNADQIVDVYNRSYGPASADRVADALSDARLNALSTAATLGRGTWLDTDGDGVFEVEEIEALGAINVVSSGNSGGAGFTGSFDSVGIYDSSQYSGLPNSRYTIAVGAVDFGGNYKNPETGSRGSWAETGANVLIVAPSQTFGIGIGTADRLVGGITTTDSSGNDGEDGANSAPFFGQELDGDYLPDTNYTSTMGGTSAAAPQVSGVVALMLEANPKLSYRDVEQILLQSAEQIDIFDETWIINAYQYFEDAALTPLYNYTDVITYGDDGEESSRVENAIVANFGAVDPNVFLDPLFGPDQWNGMVDLYSYIDEEGNTRYVVPDTADWFAGFNDLTEVATVDAGFGDDIPLLVYGANAGTQDLTALNALVTPVSGQNKGITNATTSTTFGLEELVNNELKFENGVGFTVSWGYGDYLEEYGYAHGALDAELAVQLAEAWETYDLYLDDEVTITSSVESALLRVQPAASIAIPGSGIPYDVPGGISNVNIRDAYYSEYVEAVGYTNLPDDIGSVITTAPFYDEPGVQEWERGSNRGDSRIQIPIDTSTVVDFLSVEWLEFTTQIESGDIDSLRISILSPDGTQSELSPYRASSLAINQTPQTQQGVQTPGYDILDESFGRTLITNGGTTAFIDGQEDFEVQALGLEDALASGQTWTWTTNRHWGEIFSVEAQNDDIDGANVTGQWYIVMENWGDSAVEFSNEYEVAIHGTEATGNRIQGKVGVDDNAQAREDQDGDEVFNFDRYVTFGQTAVSTAFGFSNIQVVLDDATDSVHYNNNYYETVDDTTGEVFRYPVVDAFEYTALAEITKGAIGSDLALLDTISTVTGSYLSAYSAAEVNEWYNVYGAKLGFDPNPVTDEVDPAGMPLVSPITGENILSEADLNFWRTQLLDMVVEDIVAAETFEPQLNLGVEVGTTDLLPGTDSSGFVLTYQNFDYNQENFASNVIVQATQYAVNYDSAGNALARVATGIIDNFVTGADGNYWFDVAANPAPPELADFVSQEAYDATYDQWFSDFGVVYEYDISLAGDSSFLDRIIDTDYSSDVNMVRDASGYLFSEDILSYGSGSINYQDGQLLYNVPIFASEEIHNGQTTVLKDVNFLLEVDPAKTNVAVTGSVYRDQDGDNIFDSTEAGAAGTVVYHDANTNGILDVDEVSATVGTDGNYALTVSGITSQQDITLSIDQSTIPTGLELLLPLTGSQSVNVTPGTSVDVDFTMQRTGGEPALVQGVVYEDANQDGSFDTGEFGLGTANQVTVYIDVDNDGFFDVGEPSAVTASDGTFAIESEVGGTFNVRVDLDNTPLTLSSPVSNAISVGLVVGEAVSDLEFGMYDSRTQDFGDLAGYPTTLAENGARHVVVDGVHLGARVDIDDDGNPTSDARGDDLTGTNDEDGVVILGDIVAGQDFQLEIYASGVGASLNAWVDFNNDGDWDDEGEQIFINEGLMLDQKNILTVTAPMDVDASAVALASRFRWGPFSVSYDGPANMGEVEDYLLPVSTPVNISGVVREDADGDGIFETTDTPVENVVVYYDANLDGIRQDTELSSVTNAAGEYNIAISTNAAIDVTLRIDESSLPVGEEFVSPIDGIFSQTVSPGVPETANFLVGLPQAVQGNVFADNNNSGSKDGAESGFAGITVNLYADTNNDNFFEQLIGTAQTDASGNYYIPVAVAGAYEIRLDLAGLEFHSQTTPGTIGQEVAVGAGAVTDANAFGIYNATLDFTADYGDLADSEFFPTLESNTLASAAKHTVVSGYYLGSGVDADPGTLTSSDATADDNSLTDDEDGVVLVSDQILTNSTIEIDVTVTGVADGSNPAPVLNAWIDFNNDGDWNDAGEQILIDRALTSGATTRIVIDTTGIDVSTTADTLAARFRWGSIGLGYGGADTFGEVEDYLLPTDQAAPITGDYDNNGTVDNDDWSTWVANYGSTTNLDADGNNDGKVDAADYSVWRDAYTAAQSVPAALTAPSEGSASGETIYASPIADQAAQVAASQVAAATAVEETLVAFETVEVVVAPTQSLALSAAVLVNSSQDELFADAFEVASEESLVEEAAVDSALLGLVVASSTEVVGEEVNLFEEEEDEEAALAEAFGEALMTL